MHRIRIGIVGAGFGVLAHLPALQNHPRFEVAALASPTTAAGVAREKAIPHAFRSCAEMLAGCELDAVTVASPPFAHRDDVLAALGARKHVLCEKPFALNVAQAREMCDAAGTAGVATGVVHEFRFVSQLQALAELAANEHLGPLRNIEITLLRNTLRREERRSRSWWFERKCGGGLTGAVLSHCIDLASRLAGAMPARSLGIVRTANPQRHDERGPFVSTVDDGAAAIVDYGDGLFARLCVDGTAALESFTVAVHGERRTGVAGGESITDLTLYAVDAGVSEELTCTPSPYAAFAQIQANVPPLMELYDHFALAIDGEPNALPSFADALATQRVLESTGYSEPVA